MADYLEGLNEAQAAAVTATEGFVRVVAGAGSGKTRALSRRFAFLVEELGVLPSNILCITFTNKAAAEMRQRIRQLTQDNDTGRISTFHSLCVSILKEDAYAVQYPESFLVLDNNDIDTMLGVIYEERGLTLRDMAYKDARDMFEMRKCKTEPDYCRDLIALPIASLREKYLRATAVKDILFYGYLYEQRKCFGLDYNDLINFVLYIFKTNADIRDKWQRCLEYIMVDEFQDIDDLQYRLLEVLCGYHKNLFIVGDPDQTIYTWRGANVKYLLDFDAHFPGTRTILMMENYRSVPEILDAANSLISKNQLRMEKKLVPGRKVTENNAEEMKKSDEKSRQQGIKPDEILRFAQNDSSFQNVSKTEEILTENSPLNCFLHTGYRFAQNGKFSPDGSEAEEIRRFAQNDKASQHGSKPKVLWHHARSQEEEARWVSAKVRELVGEGYAARDIAILYRAHYVTRTLEEVFIKEETPYRLYSGVAFYERSEIKDALSYLRLLAFGDDLSFARVVNRPKRNVGERRMRAIRECAERNGRGFLAALRDLAGDELFRKTGAEEFLQLVDEFREKSRQMGISELLSDLLTASGYEQMLRTEGGRERLDNLAELKQSVYEYETSCGEEAALSDYLRHVALFSNADTAENASAVKCMTVHAAKGLEFPCVILLSMEEGVFPAKKTADRAAMEEERRLAFVAVTRAMERLYFTDSEGRNFDGSYRFPSRFLLDIDRKYLTWENEPDEGLVRKAREAISGSEKELASRAEEALPAGSRICHAVFGKGEILAFDEKRNAYEIQFDKLETPRVISRRVKLSRCE